MLESELPGFYERHRWTDFHGTRRMTGLRIGDVLVREDFDMIHLQRQTPSRIPFGPLEELARESKKYTVLGRELVQENKKDQMPELIAYKCGSLYIFGPPKIIDLVQEGYSVKCNHCDREIYHHIKKTSNYRKPRK